MELKGNIVDIRGRKIFPGVVTIEKGIIRDIRETEEYYDDFILPGFVDAHIHIESSMLIPSSFASIAVCHGTVATVSDPHEIANVLGLDGVRFMIENGKKVPFKFCFGAPSCVPATTFETAGAKIDSSGIDTLLQMDDIYYLAEMMNYPGVLFEDEEVMKKLALAVKYQKVVDGHAPGLSGKDAVKYIQAGISTDHECFTYDEAKWKLENGMKILIREGSAAKNYTALAPLIKEYPDKIMFCSDDKHPDDLLLGHINKLAARAVAENYDLYDVLWATCIHPVEHYNLPVGTLRKGDPADMIIVENLKTFNVKKTLINGSLVFEDKQSLIPHIDEKAVNNFNANPLSAADLKLKAGSEKIQVIEAINGEIVTKKKTVKASIKDGLLCSDVDNDVLKIVVINRYGQAPPAIAMISGFGLSKGAIASCIGHDSHNIIAVGVDDASIADVVNAIIEHKGGISASDGQVVKNLPLPFAGIMSGDTAETVGKQYALIDHFVKDTLGSSLTAPFMTLSFMPLLVIPSLKLSDKGLFDGEKFEFTELFV